MDVESQGAGCWVGGWELGGCWELGAPCGPCRGWLSQWVVMVKPLHIVHQPHPAPGSNSSLRPSSRHTPMSFDSTSLTIDL